ncbi:Valine--tRNA ligase [Buchnera aphidicola (Tetraneura ulmi)]|uniref:valine--tRNA ligase n=1 Tax=Buchnera aphidicola TaxID=9 RepID=UPI00346458C5
MKKKFISKEIESNLYDFWEKKNFFSPNYKSKKGNFCIVIPPPNITGKLHMGHAFQQTLMDIIIRYQRIKGKNTFWQSGTDHAGIATQVLIEKEFFRLEENRKINTKENFIKKIWKWKEKLNFKINNQMRRLGNSIDWSKERFTLDEEMSIAVRQAFIKLYEKKLIYKSKKLSNWDISLKTVISDLEVEYRQVSSKMWNICYPFVKQNITDKTEYLVVSTTRPETLFGDIAISVHPSDIRYKKHIGKFVSIPLINRIIPVISDYKIDLNKGTGCVKITPAHDFKDYEIAKRKNLPMINIFKKDGKLRNSLQFFDTNGNQLFDVNFFVPSIFKNLDRCKLREKVILEIKKLGLLKEEIKIKNTVPYGDRTGTIIEPMLTDQWYLNTKPLSILAIECVKKGDIKFIPEKYKNVFFSWMENINDWCISRQLWWGHQIPVWYDEKNNVYVGNDEKEVREKYRISKETVLNQEKDVLDTWFSSGLWCFASLGWPKKTDLFKNFYPTDILVTGFDIIFFWVSRMIFLSTYLIKDKFGNYKIPFKRVLVTGLIRDEFGKKMSKSKGNVIDPLDVINGISLSNLIKKRIKYISNKKSIKKISDFTKFNFPNGIEAFGTDSLRLYFSFLSTPKQDIHWNYSRLKFCKNFCTKLWNASRFVLLYLEEDNAKKEIKKISFSFPDYWIFIELNILIREYSYEMKNYRFDVIAQKLYDFFWNKFCDWYLEFAKVIRTNGNKIELQGTKYSLKKVLITILILLHPIIPYITEYIWREINKIDHLSEKETILEESFPVFIPLEIDNKIIQKEMIWFQKKIIEIRNIRIKNNFHPKIMVSLFLKNIDSKNKKYFKKYENYFKKMSYLDEILFFPDKKIEFNNKFQKIDGAECFILKKNNK